MPKMARESRNRDLDVQNIVKLRKLRSYKIARGHCDTTRYETSLRRSNPQNADALINDTITTTTTVEVFRTPLDPANPGRLIMLPPPPVPSIDDRPQSLHLNGPACEKWACQRTETLINDRPIQTGSHPEKAVQWKKLLVDEQGRAKVAVYDPYCGPRSPYKNAVSSSQPSIPHHIQLSAGKPFDERLVSYRDANRAAYHVQSPTQFSQVSHPFITSSQNDLDRLAHREGSMQPKVSELTNDFHELVGHPAIPDTSVNSHDQNDTPILSHSTNSGYEQVRRSLQTSPPRSIDSRAECRNLPSPHLEAHRTRFDKVTTVPSGRRRSRRSHSSLPYTTRQ
ncbi:hypothetical protein KIN20_027839 [Parelaphostrongylus tenuis]|uniref:Uncharacterized protein n=1 Tax=Parelaphostrongylus tenuis TaxID=148309 RepID=A0AAD5WE91_PARTN|nr:hypothetical protein KIN20_027839 [Parelaphostrongylus tenuis]